MRKIKAKKDSIHIVREAIEESSGKDDAEITCRSILESCLQDGIVAFQKYCDGMYEPFGKPPLNTFQRLEQGSEYWKKAVGSGYEDWLSMDEINLLAVLFQKRHLLSHSEGIVDARYIQKSKDKAYKERQ